MKYTSILFVVFILLFSCQNEQALISKFDEGLKGVQKEHIPDKALDVFKAELSNENGAWQLSGATTVASAKSAITDLATSILGNENYQNSLQLLPDADLGDSTFGIVTVSVAHLKRNASHSSELIDETIMGRQLKLLKRVGSWYLSQTDYGYVGYVHPKQIVRTNDAGAKTWSGSDKVLVTSLSGRVFTKMSDSSTPVCDIVVNATLKKISSAKEWTEVELPNGQSGFIKNELITNFDGNYDKSLAGIIKSAKSMLGLPYLWGGNSSKGNDCSGFTQTVYKAHGIDLPRDARQIAVIGEEVVPDENFTNIQPGDLLFFGEGERVTHVGISLGGEEFIHQAGNVHINSLNSEKENYNAYRKKYFKHVRRVVN